MSSFSNVSVRRGFLSLPTRLAYKGVRKLLVLSVTHLIDLDIHTAQTVLDRLTSSDTPPPPSHGRGTKPKDSAAVNAEYRFLSADEVRRLAQDATYDLPAEMADRLLGVYDFCFAALHEGKVVSYSWFAVHSIEEAHNSNGDIRSGVAMSFGPGVAYRYKGYTLPEARGRGFNQNVVLRGALALAAQKNVRRIITTIDWTNGPALRSCFASNHQSLGRIWRFGWGQQIYTLWPRLPGLDVRFDDQAQVAARAVPAAIAMPQAIDNVASASSDVASSDVACCVPITTPVDTTSEPVCI